MQAAADKQGQTYSVQFHIRNCRSATILSKRNSDLLPTEAGRFRQAYTLDFACSYELGRQLEGSEKLPAPMPRHGHGIRRE